MIKTRKYDTRNDAHSNLAGSSMDLLVGYEKDLHEAIRTLSTSSGGSEEAEEAIFEAQHLLSQMRLSLGRVEPTERTRWKAKLRQYASDVESSQRNALICDVKSNDSTDEVMDSLTQGYQKQTDTLNDARRILADTEEVAQGILLELGEQREVIERTTGNARKMNEELTGANKLLNDMGKWWRG